MPLTASVSADSNILHTTVLSRVYSMMCKMMTVAICSNKTAWNSPQIQSIKRHHINIYLLFLQCSSISNTILGLHWVKLFLAWTKLIENITNFYNFKFIWYETYFIINLIIIVCYHKYYFLIYIWSNLRYIDLLECENCFFLAQGLLFYMHAWQDNLIHASFTSQVSIILFKLLNKSTTT